MSCVSSTVLKNQVSYVNDIGLRSCDTALDEDYKSLWLKDIDIKKYYLTPFSRQMDNPYLRFLMLKNQWDEETLVLSSLTEISMHPSYQQIIGMGQLAVPMILFELGQKPDHWFWALKSITGEDPVSPEQRGRMKQMANAWLSWGKEKGYIEK